MALTFLDALSTPLVAVIGLGPWGTLGVLAFVAFAALLGGLGRLFRMRAGARGRRGGPYRPDPRRPMYDVELRWHARSGILWGALSLLTVALPMLLAQWTPGWLAVVIALVAPPAAFALARVCERWRDSPLTPNQLAVGWVAWGAVTALVGTIERRQALGSALADALGGQNAGGRGLGELLIVALAGTCSLAYALIVADAHAEGDARRSE